MKSGKKHIWKKKSNLKKKQIEVESVKGGNEMIREERNEKEITTISIRSTLD